MSKICAFPDCGTGSAGTEVPGNAIEGSEYCQYHHECYSKKPSSLEIAKADFALAMDALARAKGTLRAYAEKSGLGGPAKEALYDINEILGKMSKS